MEKVRSMPKLFTWRPWAKAAWLSLCCPLKEALIPIELIADEFGFGVGFSQ